MSPAPLSVRPEEISTGSGPTPLEHRGVALRACDPQGPDYRGRLVLEEAGTASRIGREAVLGHLHAGTERMLQNSEGLRLRGWL
jgi:hypothetical protein